MKLGNRCVMLVFALVLALGLAGCAGPTPTEGGSSGATPASNEKKAEAPKPLDLAIGKTADYGDFSVTVTKVGKGPKDLAEDATYQVDVTYQNAGEEAISFNEYDWSLEDADGGRTQETAMVDKDSLGSGDIAPGGKKSGSIFYTTKADKVVKIIYAPSFLAEEDNLASWKVK